MEAYNYDPLLITHQTAFICLMAKPFFSLPVTESALTNDWKIIVSNFVPCTALAAEKKVIHSFYSFFLSLILFVPTKEFIYKRGQKGLRCKRINFDFFIFFYK